MVSWPSARELNGLQPLPSRMAGVVYTGLSHGRAAHLKIEGAVGGFMINSLLAYSSITTGWQIQILVCSDVQGVSLVR